MSYKRIHFIPLERIEIHLRKMNATMKPGNA